MTCIFLGNNVEYLHLRLNMLHFSCGLSPWWKVGSKCSVLCQHSICIKGEKVIPAFSMRMEGVPCWRCCFGTCLWWQCQSLWYFQLNTLGESLAISINNVWGKFRLHSLSLTISSCENICAREEQTFECSSSAFRRDGKQWTHMLSSNRSQENWISSLQLISGALIWRRTVISLASARRSQNFSTIFRCKEKQKIWKPGRGGETHAENFPFSAEGWAEWQNFAYWNQFKYP